MAHLSRTWYAWTWTRPFAKSNCSQILGQCRQLPRLRPHGPLLHSLAHMHQLDRRQEDPHPRLTRLVGLQRGAVPEQPLWHGVSAPDFSLTSSITGLLTRLFLGGSSSSAPPFAALAPGSTGRQRAPSSSPTPSTPSAAATSPSGLPSRTVARYLPLPRPFTDSSTIPLTPEVKRSSAVPSISVSTPRTQRRERSPM